MHDRRVFAALQECLNDLDGSLWHKLDCVAGNCLPH